MEVEMDCKRTLMQNLSSLFKTKGHYVKKLMNYTQSGDDLKLAERAVATLVKKLKKKRGAIDEFVKAVRHPERPSKCITIERSLDGRIQVLNYKGHPHVLYCRLWRWADLRSYHELKNTEACKHPFSTKNTEICINPYHYKRVEVQHLRPVMVRKLVIDDADMAQIMQLNNKIPDTLPENVTLETLCERENLEQTMDCALDNGKLLTMATIHTPPTESSPERRNQLQTSTLLTPESNSLSGQNSQLQKSINSTSSNLEEGYTPQISSLITPPSNNSEHKNISRKSAFNHEQFNQRNISQTILNTPPDSSSEEINMSQPLNIEPLDIEQCLEALSAPLPNTSFDIDGLLESMDVQPSLDEINLPNSPKIIQGQKPRASCTPPSNSPPLHQPDRLVISPSFPYQDAISLIEDFNNNDNDNSKKQLTDDEFIKNLLIGEQFANNQYIDVYQQDINYQQDIYVQVENQKNINMEAINQQCVDKKNNQQQISHGQINNQNMTQQQINNQHINQQIINNLQVIDHQYVDQHMNHKQINNNARINNQNINQQQINNQHINQQINNLQINNQHINQQQINNLQINNQHVNQQQINNLQTNTSQYINQQQINNLQINNQHTNQQKINNPQIIDLQAIDQQWVYQHMNQQKINNNGQINNQHMNQKQINNQHIYQQINNLQISNQQIVDQQVINLRTKEQQEIEKKIQLDIIMNGIMTSPQVQNQQNNESGPTPVSYIEQAQWITIGYYEQNTRVGASFRGSQNVVTVDGSADPNENDRLCLGNIDNPYRAISSETARQGIGQGIQLHNVNGAVFLEVNCENAVFVQAMCCNKQRKLNEEAVIRMTAGTSLKIFDAKFFSCMLQEAVNKNSFKDVYKLINMCIVRLSFIKGWGVKYQRRDATETPCWLEIHLNGPLQWLDAVLVTMGSPLEAIGSIS